MDYSHRLSDPATTTRATFPPAMPIEFSCTNCNKQLRVPDGSEGKPCQCPACGAVATVPVLPKLFAEENAQSSQPIDDDKVSVTCPNCQYALRCKPELLGTKGQCKQCKHVFVIGESQTPPSSKPALVFSCPKCDQLFDGKAEMAGRKGRCHACGEVFVIELKEAAASTTPLRSLTNTPAPPADPTQPALTSATSNHRSTHKTSAKRVTSPKPTETIQLICGGCSGGLEVPKSAAGQKTACPHCKQILQVPDARGVSQKSSGNSVFDQPTDDIFGGLGGGTSPQPATSSSIPFDFGSSTSNSGSQPYTYPGPAYQPHLNQQPYPQPDYSASTYESPYQPSYQSPYQSPSSMAMSQAQGQGDRSWLRSVASWHKQLIWSFVLNIAFVSFFVLCMILLALLAAGTEPSPGIAISIGVCYVLTIVGSLGLSVWFMISYVALCIKLYDGGKATLFILGYFIGGCIPFLPLVLLILVISNANSALKRHGVQVGFFGADLNSI